MNWCIYSIAIIFGIIKMNFFGWHFEPQSGEEVICDGIMFLMFALSIPSDKKEIIKC